MPLKKLRFKKTVCTSTYSRWGLDPSQFVGCERRSTWQTTLARAERRPALLLVPPFRKVDASDVDPCSVVLVPRERERERERERGGSRCRLSCAGAWRRRRSRARAPSRWASRLETTSASPRARREKERPRPSLACAPSVRETHTHAHTFQKESRRCCPWSSRRARCRRRRSRSGRAARSSPRRRSLFPGRVFLKGGAGGASVRARTLGFFATPLTRSLTKTTDLFFTQIHPNISSPKICFCARLRQGVAVLAAFKRALAGASLLYSQKDAS